MPDATHHDRSADGVDRRGWARRLLDRLLGRDAEYDRAQAEIDRIDRKVKERHARGTRRTQDPPL
jgi:hypothetical protein